MLFSALVLLTACAPANVTPTDGYRDLLKQHVKNGRVDYDAIKKNRAPLDNFIKYVAQADLPSDRNKRLGMWFDAYNALVIQSVLDHNKPRSVLDVKTFFSEEKHTVNKKKVSLDALEKKIINPYAKDPRTHFVLVCGAVGCPILESTPFYGSDVDKRMDAATRRYLDAPIGARVKDGVIELSQIFSWYKKDFGGTDDAVRSFALRHLNEANQKKATPNAKIRHFDYNWTLNQQ